MLESEQPVPDRRIIRAARSLYTNRHRLTTIEARIDRATGELTTFLGLYGVSTATIGMFAVSWDGEALQLERLPALDGAQLPLPDFDDDDRPSADLNELVKAKAVEGCLPCPWCDTTLLAQSFTVAGREEVRLYCPAPDCEFEEY